MEYNTQQMRMPMPEYGRGIQNMVNFALTLESKEERQRCANTIIDIMGSMFPHLRDVPDFKHKLWDHLAIMADFKLDIEFPYEIVSKDNLDTPPDRIPYPQSRIRLRYYGKTLERLIEKATTMEDDNERNHLLALVVSNMKRNYITWNRESVDDDVINSDLRELSKGKLQLTDEILSLINTRPTPQYNNNNTNRHKNRNNSRRNQKH